jgi:hypothetical protein
MTKADNHSLDRKCSADQQVTILQNCRETSMRVALATVV